MKTVLVLKGGDSPERDVSLRSGTAVENALKIAGYRVETYDTINGLSAITKLAKDVDVVFLALHGKGGEDGTIQKILEQSNIRFVGSGYLASSLCFDKNAYKKFITKHGLPICRGEHVTYKQFLVSELTKKPYILKPHEGGSSIDTIKVKDPLNTPQEQIEAVFKTYKTMLLEELIIGDEITVGVLEDTVLPVIEIIPPQNKNFDYLYKYDGSTQELCPPVNVSKKLQLQAQEIALAAHKLTGCRHLSRTDFMIDSKDNLYVLETNTLPGMTDQSLFPKAANVFGLTMPELCDKLVQMALND